MRRYGDIKYWEEHYKNVEEDTTFDWLEEYPSLKEIISSLKISKESGKILNVGCGNSELSENMYDDGYNNIYNIDISNTVINIMTERSKNRPGMIYEVMDVCDIKYDNNLFDLVIDKSTMDALLCGDDYCITIAKMLKEIQRVLKVDGYYMIISYEEPDYRMMHLKRKFLKFNVEIKKIEQNTVGGTLYDNYHYIYLCKKLEGADEVSEKFFDETIKELIEQEEFEEGDEWQEEKEYKENKNEK